MDDETECDISFFGYIRGTSMRMSEKVFIPGLGDFPLKNIEKL